MALGDAGPSAVLNLTLPLAPRTLVPAGFSHGAVRSQKGGPLTLPRVSRMMSRGGNRIVFRCSTHLLSVSPQMAEVRTPGEWSWTQGHLMVSGAAGIQAWQVLGQRGHGLLQQPPQMGEVT